MLDDEPTNPGKRDSSTRLIAESSQKLEALWDGETTGRRKAMHITLNRKYKRLKWLALAAPFVAGIVGTAGWWVWGAIADKAKAQITADVAADVTTLQTDVGTLKNDVGAMKIEQTEQGRTLKHIRRKIDEW